MSPSQGQFQACRWYILQQQPVSSGLSLLLYPGLCVITQDEENKIRDRFIFTGRMWQERAEGYHSQQSKFNIDSCKYSQDFPSGYLYGNT